MLGGKSVNSFINYSFLERLIISGLKAVIENEEKERMVPSYLTP